MRFQFFKVPTQDSLEATNELNTFCAQHRISHIEKQFVAEGASSFWSICVTFLDSEGPLIPTNTGKRNKTIDYKEVLNDDDFRIYSQIRDLRKIIAEREGTPAYNIFTNEQLANIVRQRVTTKTDLLALEGIGQTRVDKYGELFITKIKAITGTDKS